jgi:biotin-dependent carboxylase-like uncharacterized protein
MPMDAALLAVAPTPFVTLQDAGRIGWQRFGVSRSGAMDIEALAAANALVGNPPDTAALEFAYAGGEWEVATISCRVAVTGGRFPVFVDDEPAPAFTTITLTRGQTLRIGGAPDAVWGYLAVAGGFDLPRQLGSLATHCRSGVGGLGGRPIHAGDVLPLVSEWVRAEPERALLQPPLPHEALLRVMLGPQDDYFAPSAVDTFLSVEYKVTHQIDRLGYRLEGPSLAHAKGYNIISDGYVPGRSRCPAGASRSCCSRTPSRRGDIRRSRPSSAPTWRGWCSAGQGGRCASRRSASRPRSGCGASSSPGSPPCASASPRCRGAGPAPDGCKPAAGPAHRPGLAAAQSFISRPLQYCFYVGTKSVRQPDPLDSHF